MKAKPNRSLAAFQANVALDAARQAKSVAELA